MGVTHLSAVALILTPLCFVSGLFFNPMYGLSMMIFIIGCYFFSKAETVAHTLFYGIYFGLWVLFSKPSVLEAEINRYEKMQEMESFL